MPAWKDHDCIHMHVVAEASEDHAHVQFNHLNQALLVVVRCEVSGASKATPAVAEASGSYLYQYININWFGLIIMVKLMHTSHQHSSLYL